MISILSTTPSSSSSALCSVFAPRKLHLTQSPSTRFTPKNPPRVLYVTSLKVRASSSDHAISAASITRQLKSLAKTAILIGAAASFAGKLSTFPAKAESPATTAGQTLHDYEEEGKPQDIESQKEKDSIMAELLESNGEAVEAMRSLLQQKLEKGEDEEALKILERLYTAQPEETDWKFLKGRLLNEMGRTQEARQMFEEILERNPLSFEALFENALLMDRSGEGEAVLKRLQEALGVAEEEKKVREARDVRLIMAQIQFLQKDVDGALRSYEELTKEDPSDFRPYFCRGMIYTLLDRNAEAREQFAKYRELSPKKFEVEGYLKTPLSRMKLFGTNEEN